jgi:serine/threonine protein phosphatase PrpC
VDLMMELVRCSRCETSQPRGHRFCEECGSALAATRAEPDGPDTVEHSVGAHLAGVSHCGHGPVRNEDAFALASDPAGDVLVVCDGVSTSPAADRASTAAARAACDAALMALRAGADGGGAVADGVRAAEIAVRALACGGVAPLSTIVLAVRRGRRLAIGWLGDSRAYFVGSGPPRRLTDDHNPFTEAMTAGHTRAEALTAPDAFALTRTLGGPSGARPDEPDVVTCDLPPDGGCLVLCTDGFWRAAPEPASVRALLDASGPEREALPLARALVRHGCDGRGRDNVTVAVLLVPPSATSN